MNRKHLHRRVIGLLACLAWGAPSLAAEDAAPQWIQYPLTVPDEVREKVFATPGVKTPPGYRASVLVPPGSGLYDPFDIHVLDERTLWVADDSRGGTLFRIALDGAVSVLGTSKMHPPISLDVAPPSFGRHAGHVYTVAFARPEKDGGWKLSNAITRYDTATFTEELVCFLPANQAGEPGAGSFFARFGPANSPFDGKLFITAGSNMTIYQVLPDDRCEPFIMLDRAKWGAPRGISFTPDGQTMLVGSAVQDPEHPNITSPGKGSIMRIAPDGSVAEKPFAAGLHEPGAMAFAPPGFGEFSGELFISDAGSWDNDVPPTEPVSADGKVYRITASGELVVFATGFMNPVGVNFAGNTLVISDINGDFHVGQHKIPIGFMVSIDSVATP